ncbi:MAG: carboxypeptidase-like regulatory domain-containing protein [Acidobacteriia bacterium]|nr:carboxypeptidase-like regulatory domain-containing protein [Terriglobia bacterium]
MKTLLVAALLCLCTTLVIAQGNTAAMSGTVTDQSGAAVPGAEVQVVNTALDQTVKTTSNERGEWSVPALGAGTYRVSVTKPGFRTATTDGIVMNSGVPQTVNSRLEIGQANETVTVTGGAEIVQTNSAAISSTIGGRQLFELPFATRNAVELLVTQPGVQTPTNPRSSSVNGLPRGALNVTIDGMNTQDNMLKSSDGFFSYIYPTVDALDELTVTTSAGSADMSGQGAAQIKFVTKSGTNQFHGGGFYQRRQTGWDANYYFNNQQGLQRDVVKLTQRGIHIGGPIKKDKAFFFINFEQYLLPGTKSYTRQILTNDALNGNFSYCPSGSNCIANPGLVKSVNVYTLAGAAGQVSTPDPILLKTFQAMNATAAGGVVTPRIASNADYNRVDLNYQPNGDQTRNFLTSRLDYNITNNHHLSVVYNYDHYISVPDFLNNVVAAFPGTGTVLGTTTNTGQFSNRFDGTISLRSQFGSHVTNEWRGGLNGGTVLFFPDVNPGLYSQWNGFRPLFTNVASNTTYVSGVSTATSMQRRNSPVKDVADSIYVVKGSHQFSFGGEFTQVNSWQQIASNDTMPSITFGAATGDPIISQVFNGTNLPGSSATNQSDAQTLYSILTGRVSSISKQLTLDEQTKKYSATPTIDRDRQREFGLFAQDTWRAARNLTLSIGLRYEKQGAYTNLNGLYSSVGYAGLWGLSGVGNLFQPGTLTGVTPQFTAPQGSAYTTPGQWAPSIGAAWQAPGMNGILGRIFGSHDGASVLRVGYSLSTVREGQQLFISLWGANQGITETATVSNAATPADFGTAGSVLFRNNLPTKSGLLAQQTFPIPATFNTSLNDFQPNMSLGYVQSWNIGWQRELGHNSVIEFRYTGNHGVHLWRQYNLDEVNIFENGFLNEFQIAQNNLRIARGGDITKNTNINNWGNTGLAGQQAVPILQTAIGNTTDATLAQQLLLGQAGGAANNIATNATRIGNLTKATSVACGGKPCPVNMFVVNPTVASGGSFAETNDGTSYYDALQIEVRRRLSSGLSLQGSYVWSKSLADGPTNSSSSVAQPTTLRNLGIDKVPTGFDMRHAIKANYIYELPFGPGKALLGSVGNSVVRKALEGWEMAGVVRIQSGTPFFINGLATFDQVTSNTGITLNNLTASQLQSMVNIRKTTGSDGKGLVFFLPQSLIDNSMAAFNVGGKTPADLHPNEPYLGPAPAGSLGWRGYLYQNWNRFFDASIVKRTRIRETMNLEFRATALNVFNMTNFGTGASGTNYNNIGAAFGQVSGAYRDISGTVEPGGRILEFMLRFNF